MKILICNKWYHLQGGAERYLFALSEYLPRHGHQVVPFSVRYRQNRPSPFSHYFMSPPVNEDEPRIGGIQVSLGRAVRLAGRAIYSLEARRKIKALIRESKPDVAYLLNIVNHISPSVIDGCKSQGLPVAMRLSDYFLICPSFHFLRDGQPCVKCKQGYYHGVLHRCVNQSLAASTARVLSMYLHRWLDIYHRVDAFVTPTRFMADQLLEAGFDEHKIVHIPSFVDLQIWTPGQAVGDYILYFGRLAPEKGVQLLLQAYEKLLDPPPLYLVGDGVARHDLEAYAQEKALNSVCFLGFQSGAALRGLVRDAAFSVVPSLWPDNAPLSILESYACGRPVIGSHLGGITEQIVQGETGLLFQAGNTADLSEKMQHLLDHPSLVARMGQQARQRAEERHSVGVHWQRLCKVLGELEYGPKILGAAQQQIHSR